jgi:hypothetical protein
MHIQKVVGENIIKEITFYNLDGVITCLLAAIPSKSLLSGPKAGQ